MKALRTGIVVFLIGAVAVMAYETLHWLTHVYESGVRVQTELTRMSSRVDGTIERILVKEGDHVKQGDLLIVLEHDDIELNVEALRTDLKLEAANRARLLAERKAFEADLQSKLETRRKQIDASVVEQRAIEDRLRLAGRDLERLKTLYAKKIAPEKDLAAEQDRVLILEGEAARAAARTEIARTELAQTAASRTELDVIDGRIRISEITTGRIEKTIAREEVSLAYRHIRSPIDGIVDRVYKYKGEYVEEGERILIMHDESVLWLEANVDENQIRHLRVGQQVLIHFEAWPFDEYAGAVQEIGSATVEQMGIKSAGGSQFGRPTERVPVRIAILESPPNLAPGMLAKVNIRLYEGFDLPSAFSFHRRRAGTGPEANPGQ